MLFNLGLVSTLLASAVLARPLQDRENHLSSRDLINSRWAGVEYRKGNFTLITGTFNVPGIIAKLESPISIYAGLDGISCSDVWLRAGIDILSDNNGNPYYKAYFDAHPDYGKHYFDTPVSAGDKIKLSVFAPPTASGPQNLGFAVVENLTKSKPAAEEVPFNGGRTLCGKETTLAVELGGSITDFGEVEFTDIKAYTAHDPSPVSSKPTLVQLQRNGVNVVEASEKNSSDVLVQYHHVEDSCPVA